jgi:hypothetical protein
MRCAARAPRHGRCGREAAMVSGRPKGLLCYQTGGVRTVGISRPELTLPSRRLRARIWRDGSDRRNFCTSTFVAHTARSAAALSHESIPGREGSRRPKQSAQDTGGME